MAARKFAISIPDDVMTQVDQAARRRGVTRSRFIAQVLSHVASARRDAEISHAVDAFFSDPVIAREQVATTRAFQKVAAHAGTEW